MTFTAFDAAEIYVVTYLYIQFTLHTPLFSSTAALQVMVVVHRLIEAPGMCLFGTAERGITVADISYAVEEVWKMYTQAAVWKAVGSAQPFDHLSKADRHAVTVRVRSDSHSPCQTEWEQVCETVGASGITTGPDVMDVLKEGDMTPAEKDYVNSASALAAEPTFLHDLPRSVWIGVSAAEQYKVMVEAGKLRPTVVVDEVARILNDKYNALVLTTGLDPDFDFDLDFEIGPLEESLLLEA
jgi:hypothetical protein